MSIPILLCESELRMQDWPGLYAVLHLTASLVRHHKFTFVSVMSWQGALSAQMSCTGGRRTQFATWPSQFCDQSQGEVLEWMSDGEEKAHAHGERDVAMTW